MDERLRRLERLANAGDVEAIEKLKWERARSGLDDERYLTRVRAFYISNLPEDLPVQFEWFGRHAVEVLVHSQIPGMKAHDLQMFDMVNAEGNDAGICFIDRRNKIPDGGIPLEINPEKYPFNVLSPEVLENLQGSWNVKIAPIESWALTIYHFGSASAAQQHYGRLWSVTQRKIAYRKLEAGSIGLSDKNPPDWPTTKKGFPYKSKRKAMQWIANKLPRVRAVGALQGPELKTNWQFLFVS